MSTQGCTGRYIQQDPMINLFFSENRKYIDLQTDINKDKITQFIQNTEKGKLEEVFQKFLSKIDTTLNNKFNFEDEELGLNIKKIILMPLKFHFYELSKRKE